MAERKELLGYAVPMVAKPGDDVSIMVSTEADEYEAQIVRLIHGDTSPEGPGFKEQEIGSDVTGRYPGRHQETHIGSFVRIASNEAFDVAGGVTLQAWIWPTVPQLERSQGIVARWDGSRGYGLFVDQGRVMLRVGDQSVSTDAGLTPGRWHFVAGRYDATSGAASVEWRLVEPRSTTASTGEAHLAGNLSAPGLPVLLAAGRARDGVDHAAEDRYNGKLEGPAVFDRALSDGEIDALAGDAGPKTIPGLVAAWDFAATAPHSTEIADTAAGGHQGVVYNFPMRGLTGHSWDATAFSRDDAPHQYGAIHFHDDDLEDSRWEADFVFRVPQEARSGFYAARLRGAGEVDYVPFWVSPREGEGDADIGYLVPTNTYLAYGNERLLTSTGHDFSGLTNIPIVLDPLDEYLGEHRELGGSIYDSHTDGSGVCHSTSRRPIVSMRAIHRHWVTGGPRGYAFDLYLVDWLEEKELSYDVFTDEDLHFEGLERLQPYKVIVTGSHPEYWTGEMLDALETYLDQGGRLLYLGGNGFYWVTALDPQRRHVIEVRRGIAGSRTWNSHPGELELASTGELGGIWRHRGRAPNEIVGIGFAGQGWDVDTPGYRRLPDSHDPRAAFIFEGIGDDEEIGEFGLIMNGAAGDELDRVDHALGTPAHALRLATSEGLHSDYYLVCHEDMLVTQKEIHGTDNPNLRADMVYFETPEDGAVFSVGSINWCGSLSHNGYDNNVSRITENVIRRFVE